ncbi:hypothetical protein GX51_00482 [Blastomyces parvus]|uniref:Uncharacterized protein n=1 Tax=Blastomyces parvus TaxID=2060905 RepID=A0A2B7XLG9_9EURO|nr:hypothetical protein GX51_00482 [Blastomyces parvus]
MGDLVDTCAKLFPQEKYEYQTIDKHASYAIFASMHINHNPDSKGDDTPFLVFIKSGKASLLPPWMLVRPVGAGWETLYFKNVMKHWLEVLKVDPDTFMAPPSPGIPAPVILGAYSRDDGRVTLYDVRRAEIIPACGTINCDPGNPRLREELLCIQKSVYYETSPPA